MATVERPRRRRHRPTAELVEYARERGLTLTAEGARRMRQRGEDAARDRICDIAGLIETAAELGHPLSQLQATRRHDAAGSYTAAVEQLVNQLVADRQREYQRLLPRLEAAHYSRDAHARHAAVLAELHRLDQGPLGIRAVTLVLAADAAGCPRPSGRAVVSWRWQLDRAIDHELDRLHPRRPEQDAPTTVAADGEDRDDSPRRLAMVAAIVADHARQREMAEQQLLEPRRDDGRPRRRDLATALHVLNSGRLRREVERILDDIKTELANHAAAGGWRPDPDTYHEHLHCAAMKLVRAGDLVDSLDRLGLRDVGGAASDPFRPECLIY